MSHRPRCIVLVIRIKPGLTLVLVWITRCPSQNIGRGFNLVLGVIGLPEGLCAVQCSSFRRSSVQVKRASNHLSVVRGTPRCVSSVNKIDVFLTFL